MSNLKKLLVMSASIVAIGLVGGLSVFADCEDEDRYICEEQTDFNLDDEERYLEEEDQDLDDEEEIDPKTAFKIGWFLMSTDWDQVRDNLERVEEHIENAAQAVVDAARRGMEYNANHPTDPSNPWNVD